MSAYALVVRTQFIHWSNPHCVRVRVRVFYVKSLSICAGFNLPARSSSMHDRTSLTGGHVFLCSQFLKNLLFPQIVTDLCVCEVWWSETSCHQLIQSEYWYQSHAHNNKKNDWLSGTKQWGKGETGVLVLKARFLFTPPKCKKQHKPRL